MGVVLERISQKARAGKVGNDFPNRVLLLLFRIFPSIFGLFSNPTETRSPWLGVSLLTAYPLSLYEIDLPSLVLHLLRFP